MTSILGFYLLYLLEGKEVSFRIGSAVNKENKFNAEVKNEIFGTFEGLFCRWLLRKAYQTDAIQLLWLSDSSIYIYIYISYSLLTSVYGQTTRSFQILNLIKS